MTYSAQPLTDTTSPVPVSDLQAWLGLPQTDPTLAGLLVAATDMAISYLRRDLLERQWRLVIGPAEPVARTQVQPLPRTSKTLIVLPYTGLVSVDEVKLNGEDLDPDDYEVYDAGSPAQIELTSRFFDIVQFVALYKAAMSPIPQAVKTGIIMLAAYLYDNRGCNSEFVLKNSGADKVLKPYRIETL